MSRFLVVDDEPADLALLEGIIRRMGHEVKTATDAEQAMQVVRNDPPDVVLLDVLLPDENGLDVYNQMHHLHPKMPIMFVTASGSSNVAIEAMRRGALDYLAKPLQVPKVKQAIERALSIVHVTQNPIALSPPSTQDMDRDAIIGRSPAMQEVYKSIGLVASQDVSVLVRGESGTGKELVARAIYHFSKRSDRPFLAVNCAAIPEPLLESELFGHEKGAFTGADRRRIGKFEQCNRGTLFLDEIGDMPLPLQSKILRVLQDGTFQRVGGNETIKTDVRIVAATHRNLESMVEKGEFREDLFYRLNGFTINLPPLRERVNDIELLIDFFRRQANRELDKQVQGVSPEAMALLRSYPWPGNVRELQNVMRQAVLTTSGPLVLPEFLPSHIRHREDKSATPQPTELSCSSHGFSSIEELIAQKLRSDSCNVYDEVIAVVEELLIDQTLKATGGDNLAAIRRLGINPMAFRSVAAVRLLEVANGKSLTSQDGKAAAHLPAGLGDSPQPSKQETCLPSPEESRATDAPGGGEAVATMSSRDSELHRAEDEEAFQSATHAEEPEHVLKIQPGMTMEQIEREAILQALEHTGGKRTSAAQMLGISVRTLQRKLKQYDLDL